MKLITKDTQSIVESNGKYIHQLKELFESDGKPYHLVANYEVGMEMYDEDSLRKDKQGNWIMDVYTIVQINRGTSQLTFKFLETTTI